MKPLLYTKTANLPAEVQTWLNGEEPLPSEINFYPAQTKSWGMVWPWFLLAFFFLAMGTAAPVALVNQFVRNGFTPRTGYFLFGALFLAVFLFILLYGILAGAIKDAQMILAKRNGRLRYGIFITPQDILIQLPHEMHYLPRYAIASAAEIIIQRGSQQIKAIEISLNISSNNEDNEDNRDKSSLVIKPKLTTSNQNLILHLNS